MGPGTGVETAVARLAGLPEDGRVERQQGELEIPGTPTARCRERVEGRKKMVESEPSEEVRLEENSGWRQRRGGDSRGHGGWVRRLRGWVACSASGQRGDVEGGPPRASQRSGAQYPGRKTP